VLRYYVGRRRRLVRLADAHVLNLKRARVLARERLAELTNTRRDPFAGRRGITLRELVPLFLEDAARRLKRSTVERYRLDLRAVAESLGGWSVDTLDRQAVAAAFLAWTRQRGATAANASLGRLAQLLEFGAAQGLRDADAANPAHRIKRNRERRRGVALGDEQLAAIGRELAAEEAARPEARDTVAAIRLLALTGCRRREVTGLVWGEVDFDVRCLCLRDSKTGPKTVPLSTTALEVLAGLSPGEPEARVFPAERHEAGWAIQHTWNRVRARAGVPGARLHDLRHSHVTRGLGAGLSETLVARIVGHRSVASTRRYEHVAGTADPVREGAERIGAEVAAALAGSPVAPVRSIRGRN
jgi:integrase